MMPSEDKKTTSEWKDPIIRREGDHQKRAKANADVAKFGLLKAEYRKCKKKVDDADEVNENEKSKLVRVTEELNKYTNLLGEIQEEIDSAPLPEGAQPRERINKRDKLQLQVSQLQVAYDTQSKSTAQATDDLRKVEFEMFSIDKRMSDYVDSLQEAEDAFKIQKELDSERASRLATLEKKNADRWGREQEAAVTKRAEDMINIANESKRMIGVTKKEHKKAVKRYNEANTKVVEAAHTIHDKQVDHMMDRKDVVFELKANINMVEDQVKTKASKYRKKIDDARLELEKEKESMIAKGKNPYTEFRRRDFEKADRKLEKDLKDKVAENKIALSERLLKEAEIERKEEAINRKEREYEKKFRDEQGPLLAQVRNQEYIKEVTTDHVELLDPAGRASRVDPSQITDIADYSYGLGRTSRIPNNSMRRITEKIRNSLQLDVEDFGEYQRLLADLQKKTGKDVLMARTSSAPSGDQLDATSSTPADGSSARPKVGKVTSAEKKARLEELKKLASVDGDLPGAQGAATTLNFVEEKENEELLQLVSEEMGEVSLEDSVDSEEGPKYPKAIQSKFELDAFERAKQRQRTFIDEGTQQVAGGWKFKGDSFVSKPQHLLFKDFEVGKVYKKRFALTNISYTFNSFKLLDIEDSFVDFFEISYEKPGRMSAGMSCYLDIVFSPKMNQDIFTHIPLTTQTGVVCIPLTCLIQRCAPRVKSEAIDFGEIVVGEKSYRSIKVVNSQAIGTSFSVKRVPPVIPKTAEELEAEALAAQKAAEIAAQQQVLEEKAKAANDEFTAATEALETANKGKDKKAKAAATEAHDQASTTKEVADKELQDFLDQQKADNPEAEGDDNKDGANDNDDLEDIPIGNEPAVNDAELAARVRSVITSAVRRKQKENPNVFSVVAKSSLVDLSSHRVGVKVCDIAPLDEEVIPVTSSQETFHVPGYSECIVAFLCSPLTVEPFEESFEFTFDEVPKSRDWDPANEPTVDDDGKVITRKQSVKINAVSTDLPIYLGEEEVDLFCTLHDRIYRKRIEVCNRAKTAYRVNIDIPAKYSKYIEVNPTMMFVQGGMSQDVNMKFTPKKEILDKTNHFCRLHEGYEASALFTYPLMLTAVGQSLPIFVTVKSDFTPSTMKLSTKTLNFGKVYAFQSSTMPLTITNTSMLPQKLAAVKMKKEISVQPNDGFYVLLPNETITVDVSFSPSSGIPYEFDLTLMTSNADTLNVKIKAQGIESPIELDTAVLKMRSTFSGERVLEDLFFKNTSNQLQTIQLMPPATLYSWLKFSPTVLQLEPGERQRVECDFNPPKGLQEMDAKDWYKETVGKAGESVENPFNSFQDEKSGRWAIGEGLYGTVQWSNALWNKVEEEQPSSASLFADGEQNEDNKGEGDESNVNVPVQVDVDGNPIDTEEQLQDRTDQGEDDNNLLKVTPVNLEPTDWGIVSKWNIPIFIEKKQPKGATKVAFEDSILFVNVETVVNPPEVEVDTTYVDFGQSAVGIRMTKMVKIRNKTNRVIRFKQKQLVNAVGPFEVLNFVRELQPGSMVPLLFNCVPTTPSLSLEQLVLASDDGYGHQLRFTLKVQGVNPTVKITGLIKALNDWGGPHGGILDFGNVVAGDVCKKVITVTNNSEFTINMDITRAACEGLSPFKQSKMIQRTASGLPIYACRPERCKIESGKSRDVEFTFRPDRGREQPFREDINISVGQSDGLIKVCLAGRAVSRQVFVAPTNPTDEPFYRNMNKKPLLAPLSDVETDLGCLAKVSDILVEDLYGQSASEELRNSVEALRRLVGVDTEMQHPSKIKLEYPDPFAEGVDESSYEIIQPGAAGGKGAKGAPAPAATVVTRKQIKKLTVHCAQIFDGRAGSTGGGTFEVQLSSEAISSGLFTVANEKGNVAVGGEAVIEIGCALPTPKDIGGLEVGSWQVYDASVVLKGGWKRAGSSDEVTVPFLLAAYLRL